MDKDSSLLHARRAFLTLAGLGSAVAATGLTREALASSSVAATIPVAKVTDFASIQLAASSLTGGGILYFPEGSYAVTTPVALPSNVWVLGAGDGSVLVRGGSATAIFSSSAVTGIRISNLAFDVAASINGAAAVIFHNTAGACSDLTIEKCSFFTSTAVAAGNIGYAVYIEGGPQVRIRENHVVGLDVVAGTRSSGPGVFVQDNHIVESSRHGIAVFGSLAADTIDSVVIADNIIQSPRSAGIVVGGYTEATLLTEIAGVAIRGNIVTGAIPGPGVGIRVRLAETTTDVIIDGNVVANTGPVLSNSQGIRVSGDASGSSLQGIVVRGNTVRSVDQGGINVTGTGSGLLLGGNAIDGTRGIAVHAAGGALADVSVVNNVIRRAGVQGIRLDAGLDDLLGAVVSGNQVLDTSGYGCSGIRLVTGSGCALSAEVRGNRATDTQAVKTQWYGASEEGAGTFETRYLENDLAGNLHGGIGAVNAAAAIEDNAGVTTESRGQATINGAVGTYTIAHGLAFTPTAADIAVSVGAPPNSWLAGNVGQLWVSSVGASTFTVSFAPTLLATDTIQVNWQARVRSA